MHKHMAMKNFDPTRMTRAAMASGSLGTNVQDAINESKTAGVSTPALQNAPVIAPPTSVSQAPATQPQAQYSVDDVGKRLRASNPDAFKGFTDTQIGERAIQRKPELASLVKLSTTADPNKNIVQQVLQPVTDMLATGYRVAESVPGLLKGVGQTLIGDKDSGGRTILEAGKDVEKPVNIPFLGQGNIRKIGTVDEKGYIKPSSETVKSLGTAAELAAFAAPTSRITAASKLVPTGTNLLTRTAVRGAEGALLGSLGEAGRAARETGDLSNVPGAALQGAAAGGLLGSALPVAGLAGKGGARLVGRVGAEALGKTTGVGGEAIIQAFKNPAVMRFARMAGKNIEQVQDEVLDSAIEGLGKLRALRGDAYKTSLSAIPVDQKLAEVLPSVRNKASELLQELDIRVAEEGLNFADSTIIEGQNVVEKAFKDVLGWSGNTVGGMDTLKRRLDSYVSQLNAPGKKEAQRAVLEMKSAVRDGLEKNVPGYKEMTSGYREASELIDEISKTLSLDNPKRRDIAMKKLLSSLRPTNEDRRKLIEELQKTVGQDIIGRISGVQLSPMMPRGLAGAIGTPALGFGAVLNPAMIPNLMALAVTSSPRAVGELTTLLGKIPGIQFRKGFSPEVQETLRAFLTKLVGTAVVGQQEAAQ